MSYAHAHLPLLEKHKRAILITVGPRVQEEWADAIHRTQGRIISIAEKEKPRLYLEAADIDVDSFPFVSNTPLLEAGSYGLPLVSRYTFSDGCAVLGADMPGLADTLIRVRGGDEYTAALSRLVEDGEYRLDLGEATRGTIREAHVGMNWQRSLEKLYCRANDIPRNAAQSSAADKPFVEDLDMFMPHIHNTRSDGRSCSLQEGLSLWLRRSPHEVA